MATWTAKCWLGSSSGYQELQVQSNTWHGAKEQLERIYGAEQIINLRELPSNSQSSFSGSGSSGIGLGGVIFLAAIVALVSIFGGEGNDTYEVKPEVQRESAVGRPLNQQDAHTYRSESNSPSVAPRQEQFFMKHGIQEEAVDDLGQDWDN